MSLPMSFLSGRVILHPGDCLNVLKTMPANSVDSCVCDPPYHLTSIVKRFGAADAAPAKVGKTGAYARSSRGFMGKQWDGGDIAFRPELWAEVLRVLKPGAYILAFSSSRTFGRMSVAIEDAGFVNHPLIGWIFGQGFPKAHRVEAEGWEGWRYGAQATKPALEPIYMGQKPFSEATGTANVLRWGAGAINVDGCRVATADDLNGGAYSGELRQRDDRSASDLIEGAVALSRLNRGVGDYAQPLGRWPANLVHDGSDEVLAAFPNTSSHDTTGHWSGSGRGFCGTDTFAIRDRSAEKKSGRADSGSAARFFYSAKADADDRIGSKHPTVKPLDLMRWLVRLVTPPCVETWKCIDCGNEDLPRVSEKVSANAQRAGTLLDNMSAEGSGTASTGTRQDVSAVREGAGQKSPDLLFNGVLGHSETKARAGMPAMCKDVCAARSRAEVLLTELRGCGASADTQNATAAQTEENASGHHASGLPDSLGARRPDGYEVGLRDGAQTDRSANTWPEPPKNGSSASHQRGENGQSPGELAGDAAAGTQQSAERHASHAGVSPLQGAPDACKCPACGGRTQRSERGGLVLDPFAGTGTTGEAAWREGMRAILIERETEYLADISRRMALCLAGPEERARTLAKIKHGDLAAGPLFAELSQSTAERSDA